MTNITVSKRDEFGVLCQNGSEREMVVMEQELRKRD